MESEHQADHLSEQAESDPASQPGSRPEHTEGWVYAETARICLNRFSTLFIVNAVFVIPAQWLLIRSVDHGMAWLAGVGAVLQCVAAALCMHVALGYKEGSTSSGFALVKQFPTRRLAKVAGAFVLILLCNLIVKWVFDHLVPPFTTALVFMILASGWIFFDIRVLLFLAAVVVEGKGPLESLFRSWEVVKGGSWWVLWIAAVFPVLAFVGAYRIPEVGPFVADLLLLPFVAVSHLVIFLRLRDGAPSWWLGTTHRGVNTSASWSLRDGAAS